MTGTTENPSIQSLTNGAQFSTFDADNDFRATLNCAFKAGNKNGGFWYSACGGFQPNGEYHNDVGGQYQKFIFWNNFRGYSESLQETLMMFRKKP